MLMRMLAMTYLLIWTGACRYFMSKMKRPDSKSGWGLFLFTSVPVWGFFYIVFYL